MCEFKRTSQLNFVLIANPEILKPVLNERHPHSCFFYNQVITNGSFKDELKFYSLGTGINSNTWFVSNYFREDYGNNRCISAPSAIISGEEQISPEIKECFSSSGLIDWDEESLFLSLAKPVSSMIFDISANIKGNVTKVNPCVLYYMEIADAQNLNLSWDEETEVRRLASDDTEFMTSTWKYAKETSEIVFRKCIEANPSAGVFINGKCVAGVVTTGTGLISSLYTIKEHRKRGYGKFAMHYTYKESARRGITPCSVVESKNIPSLTFHDKLGAKVLSSVDCIDVKKLNID